MVIQLTEVGKILDTLFPRLCYGCGFPGEYFCAKCALTRIDLNYQHTCHVCGVAVFGGLVHSECKERTYLAGVIVAASFAGTTRGLVHAFKYDGVFNLAPNLARLLWSGYCLNSHLLLPGLVVPVPTTQRRYLTRGYNQALLLANAFGRLVGVGVCDCLYKPSGLASQVGKSRNQRLFAQRGKIVLRAAARATIAGKTCLLVDDVMTTGATLEAAARCLLESGAKEVFAAVCARA